MAVGLLKEKSIIQCKISKKKSYSYCGGEKASSQRSICHMHIVGEKAFSQRSILTPSNGLVARGLEEIYPLLFKSTSITCHQTVPKSTMNTI